MHEWSLDILYKGYDSKEFKEDFARLTPMVEQLKQLSENLDKADPKTNLLVILDHLEKYKAFIDKLVHYVSLSYSADTSNNETASYLAQIDLKNSDTAKAQTKINKYIASLDIDELVKSDEKIKSYEYILNEIKRNCTHLLSDEAEEVVSKMNLSGANAWDKMQQYLTSTLDVEYKGEKTTLSAIRNMAYSNDKNIRKSAYEAEIMSYGKIKDAVAFSLNNIKLQVTNLSQLRGYSSVLDMTLEDSRMKKSTLDAMLKGMEKHLPKFWSYLRTKAEKLGYTDGLPWYELFAPLGEVSTTFTPEESRTYLVNHFKEFSSDLAQMVDSAYEDKWIDFMPRKGKVGGAFCSNLGDQKVSRVLTNFDGALGDVVTLAHELGHAYHGLNIQDHLPLNRSYSMPVAETASTFNENLIMNAAIKDAVNDNEKMALIESQLQDLCQIIVDIYSRYTFESSIFERCQNGFIFADECCSLFIEAQKKAYGTGIDHSTLHPYMWVCKPHYYSGDLSFYNFPYAFGGLFARGLYAKYKEEGQPFVENYRKMLQATTTNDVEEVAKICGIDLSNADFWDNALDECDKLIDQFIELAK